VKTAILALVLTTLAPSRITVAVFGCAVSVPAGVLILAAELLAAAGTAWLAVRCLRGFRSSPYPRTAGRTS
jgi:hypothetical protein